MLVEITEDDVVKIEQFLIDESELDGQEIEGYIERLIPILQRILRSTSKEIKMYGTEEIKKESLNQCVVDLDLNRPHAMFKNVEDAELYIEWYTEVNIHGTEAPNLGICHVDNLIDYLKPK